MAIDESGLGDGTMKTIDPVSKAARETLYDPLGNVLSKTDKLSQGITPGTTQGLPILGSEYKTPRLARAMSDGSLATNLPTLLFFDPVEGAAVNTNTWIQTTTTMTIAQASGIITLNAGSSAATTVGAMHTSHRLMPIFGRSRLLYRNRQRHTAHFNNNVIELGFLNASVATTSAVAGGYSGAIWRKDGTGQYVPVVVIAGSEILGTPILNATWVDDIAANEYGIFEVELENASAIFRAYTSSGKLVSEQRIDFSANIADFTVTHLTAMYRTYNSGATGTAVQVLSAETTVYLLDIASNKPWPHVMSAISGVLASPTAYTTLTNWANNAAPTTRTLSNTAAGEALLDGVISWNNAGTSFAANDALDLQLHSIQIPVPYNFVFTGIRISTVNLGAANGAANYTIQYGIGFNSSAVSLATGAPYPPFRKALGFQTLANGAAIGASFDKDTVWSPQSPVTVFSGRFITVFVKVIGASIATLAQVIRTSVTIDGYFE